MKKIVSAILGVILVVIIARAYWAYQKTILVTAPQTDASSKQVAQAPATQIPSKSIEPTALPQNISTAVNKSNNLVTTIDESNWKTFSQNYISPNLHYSIKYPQDWSEKKELDSAIYFREANVQKVVLDEITPNSYTGDIPDGYINAFFQRYASKFPNPKEKIISVPGVLAKEFLSSNGRWVIMLSFKQNGENYAIQLTSSYAPIDSDIQFAEAMARSFKLTQ